MNNTRLLYKVAGAPVEDLEEDELDEAISELGIQEEPMTESDQAALDAAS